MRNKLGEGGSTSMQSISSEIFPNRSVLVLHFEAMITNDNLLHNSICSATHVPFGICIAYVMHVFIDVLLHFIGNTHYYIQHQKVQMLTTCIMVLVNLPITKKNIIFHNH